MNWGQIKIATLQKMFVSTATTIVENTTTLPYLNSMPAVANEALQLLSTAGKYIIKSHKITQGGTDTGLVQKYDFQTLVSDFHSFRDVYLDDGEEYRSTSLYQTEGDGVFVLPSEAIGTWTVYYNSYPQQITSATTDVTELALDPEVAVLLPLYMASELYLEDDSALATSWRNKFEVAFGKLKSNVSQATVEFVSEFEGW